MLLKELARTGVLIPEIGMGTSGYCAGPGALRKGLEAGALFVDTAESYGTEPVVGEALVGLRDRVFIATKVSPQNFSDADLRKSVDSNGSQTSSTATHMSTRSGTGSQPRPSESPTAPAAR